MAGVLIKGGNLKTDTQTGRTPCEHLEGHLQAKKQVLAQVLLSQFSEGAHPANILTLNFYLQN